MRHHTGQKRPLGRHLWHSTCLGGVALLALPGLALAQMAPSLGMYGTTGVIDMPAAVSEKDAQISTSMSWMGDVTKSTLSFQISPRLSGSFRYTAFDNWSQDPNHPYGGSTYDRSFDIHYRILNEGRYRPAVAVGLRDFMGTGLLASEYIVATKTFADQLRVSAGLGWGRLSNSDTLRTSSAAQGGEPNYDQWFRGPVAPFAGLEWQTPIEGLRLKAEYSSDRQTRETQKGILNRKSPYNFGIEYTPTRNLHIGLYSLYGDEIGLRFTAALNPKEPARTGSYEGQPLPIVPRALPIDRDTSWLETPGIATKGQSHLTTLLEPEGLVVEALALAPDGQSATLRFRNLRYDITAEAFGRAARAMAFVMPDSVEQFSLILVKNGVGTSQIDLARTDLETLVDAPNGAAQIEARARIRNAQAPAEESLYRAALYPNFSWSLGPYVALRLFDPTEPVRAQLGARLSARYDIAPGLFLTGAMRKPIIGNFEEGLPEYTGLHPVRSDIGKYQEEGDPSLERLTANYLFKLTPETYGRLTAGYLEEMYGGLSAELLWKPVTQNWGLGAEINYARQRDFNQRLGFQDYDIITGHASAYWELDKGFYAQIDAGRYLAGDWGASVSVDRVFENGWSVGAYATFTDASAEEFGEGSFDKGIRMTIPIAWALGTPTRTQHYVDLNSLSRDGGARLNVENRLYPMIRDAHQPALSRGWNRFWR